MNVSTLRRSRRSALRICAPVLCAAALLAAVVAPPAAAAKLGPSLAARLNGLANASPVGTVIVTFNTTSGLQASHLTALALAGITRGLTLQSLGMVAVPATAAQVRTLAANPAVRSLWLNDRLHY